MKSIHFHKYTQLVYRYPNFKIMLLIAIMLALFSCNLVKKDSKISIENPKEISFIGIYGKDTVEIKYNGDSWILNSDLEPDPVAVDNFLYAFKNLETVGATAGKGIDSLISRRIILQEGKKKRRFRFYASGDFYLLHHEGSVKIYKIKVKSASDANLNQIFSDRPSDWTNRLILNINPGNIRKLQVEPGKSLGEGFIMKRDSSRFRIFTLDGNEIKSTGINSEKTLLYSSYLSEIYYDSEILEDTVINRIRNDIPFYTFIIETEERNYQEFQIYPLYTVEGKLNIFEGAITLSGQNRILKINYAYLDPLFQDLSYFSVE